MSIFPKHLIFDDLYRYGSGISFRAFVKHYCLTPGFRYTFWMRLANTLKKASIICKPFYYFSRFMLYRCGLRFGIAIPYNAQIGPGLYIGHYGGIIINSDTIIGRNCNINHGVTAGVKYGGKNPGVPTIGDRVYLGPGCKVIGGVHLGNDVAVGANAVVVDHVPDSGVVAGVPARVISLKGSAGYVVNTR